MTAGQPKAHEQAWPWPPGLILAALALAAGAGAVADGQDNGWRQASIATGLVSAVLFVAGLQVARANWRWKAHGPGGRVWINILYILLGFLLVSAASPTRYKIIYAGSDYRIPYQLPGPVDRWSEGMTKEITVATSGVGPVLIRLNLHESHDTLPPLLEVIAGGAVVGRIQVKPGHGAGYPHWRTQGRASSYSVIAPAVALTPEKNEVILRPVSGSWIALRNVQIWQLPRPWEPWRYLIEPWNWLLFWLAAAMVAAHHAAALWRARGSRGLAMGASMGVMTLGLLALILAAMAVYVEARHRWMITQPDNFRSREMFYGSKHLRDSQLGWRLLPGFIGKTIANGASEPRPFYIVNNHGFRSLAEEMEFPPRGKVMALGDSFTQGAYLGQAETIPAVMARKLGSYVYNLGVGAYSTDQEYTAFTQWIDKVDVEWVVLFFFANDVIFVDQPIGHKFEKPLYRTINGKLDFSGLMPLPDEFVEEENAKVQAKIEMEKTFCCFSEMPEPVVERAMLKIRQYLFEARYPGLLFSTIVADIRKTKGKPTPSHLDVTVELLENPGKYQAQLDMVFQFLAKIKEESLKREKKYFVVFIPDFLQLYEPDIPARSNLRWAFMKSCAENGISCLDPSDELFRNSKYNDVYFIDDGHFSPHGARIVGEMVAEKIAENRP